MPKTLTKEFIKRMHLLLSGTLVLDNEKLRRNLAKLQLRRQRLYENHLAELDRTITTEHARLKQLCEHPSEHTKIEHERWYTDDGEGNQWTGDQYKFVCTACHHSRSVKTADGEAEFYCGSRLQPEWEAISKTIQHELCEIEAKQRAERQAIEDERRDREEYQRLKAKYK